MAVLTAAGTVVYALGGIGGGDIKLAIAASGMLGFPLCIPFLLYTAIGGGVLAIVFIVSRGKVRETRFTCYADDNGRLAGRCRW